MLSGISSGVSLQAKPNIIPWSPAPVRVTASSPDVPARASNDWPTPSAMSGLCLPRETTTPQLSASKPHEGSV